MATCLVALAEDKSFDNIKIEHYKDKARLKAFIDCLKRRGVCVGEEAYVRDRGQEIVETKCKSCSEKEKQLTRDLTALISQDYPDELVTLFGSYDPTAKNTQKYLKTLNTFSSQADIPAISKETIEKFK